MKLEKIIEYGFYLWLFLLPWQTRYFIYEANLAGAPWEAANIVIYGSEILLIILLALNFIAGSRQPWGLKLNKKFYKFLPLVLTIFVIYAFLSSSWSVWPALSIYNSLKLFFALGVFWLISSINVSWWRAGVILIAAGLIQGLLAIDQFLLQQVVANKWLGMAVQNARDLGVSVVDTGYRRWLRAYGSFPHPNILGGFLSIVLIALIGHYFRVHDKIKEIYSRREAVFKASLVLTMVITTSGLVLSFSRSAWLAAGLIWLTSLIMVLLKKNNGWRIVWLKLFLIFVLTVGIWAVIYPEPLLTRIHGEQALEIKASQDRISSLVDSRQVISKNWLAGVGLGSYTYALHQIYPERNVWQLQPPHNTYLLIWSELGIIGLLLFLWILVLVFKQVRQNSFFMLLYIVMIFLMMFDHWWWSLNFGWYFTFLLLALIYKKLSTS